MAKVAHCEKSVAAIARFIFCHKIETAASGKRQAQPAAQPNETQFQRRTQPSTNQRKKEEGAIKMTNAWKDLNDFLHRGEMIESIIFGDWYGDEPDPAPVPKAMQGVLLTPRQAKPMMQSWSFYGGYGGAECYPVYVWTNWRVIWVDEYDGATGLRSAPRNPFTHMPQYNGECK